MKKIIVLSCVLIVLLVSAALVYVFRPSVDVTDDSASTNSIVSTTEEEKGIGEELEKAEKNVSEQIETDSNIITYTKPDYTEIPDEVYNNLFATLSDNEIECVASLLSDWAKQLGCKPSDITYIGDNLQSGDGEIIIDVMYSNITAQIHVAYDFENEKLIGYLKVQE